MNDLVASAWEKKPFGVWDNKRGPSPLCTYLLEELIYGFPAPLHFVHQNLLRKVVFVRLGQVNQK